jgi:magnesium-transporting ATPase (P-type)
MKDPPRLDVKASINTAHNAGIKVIMITGDYGLTAKNIAQEVGIISNDNSAEIVRGEDLHKLSDDAVWDLLQKKQVIFCRASPEDKLRIVTIANQRGEIVAVTGDGANDAPALRQADIGIAMGVTGTDVAKEAADIILTDDSFSSIVKGIEGGRSIWTNLRKFIYYAYTHNWAELIPYIFFILLKTPLPILAVHILLIDLCIDIVPSLALSRIHPESSIMTGPPRDLHEHLFKGAVFARSLFIGSIIGTFAFFGCLQIWYSYGWIIGQELSISSPIYLQGITFTYSAIVVGQMGNLLMCQSSNESIFQNHLSLGALFYYSILWQAGILFLTIYLPFLQPIFGTSPFPPFVWLKEMLIVPIVIGASEIWKLMARRYPQLSS